MKKTIADFSKGFSYPFRAFGFIRMNPRLLQYIAIPLLINVAIFSLAVYIGLSFFQHFVIDLLPQGEAWYWLILTYILWIVAVLLTMILVFFSFTAFGNLIASPFNDILSEKTEYLITGKAEEGPFRVQTFMKDSWKLLREEARKVGVFVMVMFFLLLLNLLPVLGSIIYSILSVLWTLYFLVVEYTGYIFFRKQHTFKDQRGFIRDHVFLMVGFGSGLLFVLAIPFFQFLCIPIGVVGGTLLCFEVDDGSFFTNSKKGEKNNWKRSEEDDA